jgi:TolB-like protein/cytochrome c-type biogenesis protein CcmH/NrfG
MGSFFAELKRRHVYRVGAAYAVVAWVLLQLFNNVAPILEAPPWVARVLLLILALGFPIALLLAWTFEATLAGIKRETPAVAGASPPFRHSRIDWILAGALILVIALVSYQQIAPATGLRTAQRQTDAAPAPGSISIAVLPLANLSGDDAQEFFSDGMTDEITTALTKVPNLRVVGRTSAFQFKGQNRDVRAISEALQARYVIDGSVRRIGDRVRVTAQLIQADNGVNLWADNYDRELNDVFAIQEEIALAIAGALRVPLGLQQGERLVSNRTSDLESYQQYLRARTLLRSRLLDEAIAVLESAVARDPGYAPAWALLSRAYSLAPFFDPALRRGTPEEARRVVQSSLNSAERAAREAVRLDTRNAAGHAALAYVQARAGNWAVSEATFRQALELDPNEPEVLDTFSQTLVTIGRLKDALSLREKLRALEPFVPLFNTVTAEIMQINGQSRASIPVLEGVPANTATGLNRNIYLARAYASVGRYAEASDILLATPQTDQVSRRSLEDAAQLLRTAPAKASVPQSLPALEGELSFVYIYVGAPDRILEYSERSIALRNWMNATGTRYLWLPEAAPVRKTERFKTLVRNAGMVDYWRARGWPDLCRPMGTDDFECD